MLNTLDSTELEIYKKASEYGIVHTEDYYTCDITELTHLIEDWENQLQLATEYNIDWNPGDYDPQGLDIEIEATINKTNSFAKECKDFLKRSYYNNLGVN